MKTQDAIRLVGGSAKDLADLLGITPSAISQWDEELPEKRVWQLQVLRPEWFKKTVSKEAA
jgi:predicted transcriptional regulator